MAWARAAPGAARAAASGALLAALAACGGAPATTPAPAEVGFAGAPSALVARLPAAAPACLALRLAHLSPARRPLVALVSEAEPLPWSERAPFAAWAEARAHGLGLGLGDGDLLALAQVTAGDWPAVEALLAAAGVAPRRESCDEAWCVVARRLPGDVLELRRGDLPTRGGGAAPDARARCARLLAEAPDAVEVAASTAVAFAPRRGDVVVSSERVVTVDEAGVRVERIVRYPTPEDARLAPPDEGPLPFSVAIDPARMPALPHREERRVTGAVVQIRARYLWEDLALAAADRARLLAAVREPDPLSDTLDPDAPLGRWVERATAAAERLERAGGAPRAAQAEALRRFLERGRAVHPEAPELARPLARLLVDELRDGPAALALAEEVLAQGVDEARRWQLVRREAAALVGADALAAVLVAEGLVRPADAARAATEVHALLEAGFPYDAAERAWLVGHALATWGAPTRRVGVPLAIEVPDLAVFGAWLRAAAAPEAPAAGLALRASGAAVVAALGRRDPRRAPPVRAATVGQARLAWTPEPDPGAWRQAGRALLEGLGEGALRVEVGAVVGDAVHPLLVVAGELGASGRLTVRAVDAALRGVPWAALERDLLPGVGELDRLFPAPELVLVPTDAAEREDALAWTRDRSDVECRPLDGARLRCRARDARRGAQVLGELAVEVLRRRLPAASIRALAGRIARPAAQPGR